jgi:hypothetical protein
MRSMDIPASAAFLAPPDPTIKTWRYMSVGKFAMMLEQGGLFFSRMDVIQAQDAHEGSIPKTVYAASQEQYSETVLRASKSFSEIHSFRRVMVNCWHINLADVDGQALAREEVEHGQRTEPPPIGELIGDEVHAPDVIPRGRWSSLLAVDGRRMAPRALPAER